MKRFKSLDYLEVTIMRLYFQEIHMVLKMSFIMINTRVKSNNKINFMNDRKFIENVVRTFNENQIIISKTKVKVEKTKAFR